MNKSCTSIDQYILESEISVQHLLVQIRETIHRAAPEASEAIKYGMPTFVLHENLVHFAACKNHIGFYPAPSAIQHFEKRLSGFVTTKGAIQFPREEPMPFKLITEIVKFRVMEATHKAREKSKRTCKNGHSYYKSSACPVCPVCEKLRKPKAGFLVLIGAPARRALESKGINTLKKLSSYREEELLSLHGFGKSSLPKLKAALKKEGLSFKIKKQS